MKEIRVETLIMNRKRVFWKLLNIVYSGEKIQQKIKDTLHTVI